MVVSETGTRGNESERTIDNRKKRQGMYELGDKLTMKKPHACGGNAWQIVRLGVDVKLQCETCKKFVNVTRDDLKKRAKTAIGKENGEKK